MIIRNISYQINDLVLIPVYREKNIPLGEFIFAEYGIRHIMSISLEISRCWFFDFIRKVCSYIFNKILYIFDRVFFETEIFFFIKNVDQISQIFFDFRQSYYSHACCLC